MLIICFVLFAILIIIVSASLGAFSFANINQMLIVFKEILFNVYNTLSTQGTFNKQTLELDPRAKNSKNTESEKHHYIFEACFGEVC